MTKELIELLRQGATISRERDINLDYAKVADRAADVIEELSIEIGNKINYCILYEFAQANNISYNELCSTVQECLRISND